MPSEPSLRLLVMGALREHPTAANRAILQKLLHDDEGQVREAAEAVAAELTTLKETPMAQLADKETGSASSRSMCLICPATRSVGMIRIGSRGRSRDGKPPGWSAGWACRCSFLFFFAMGSLFEMFILREFVRVTGQWAWSKTPCAIVRSEVQERDDDDSPYAFVVSYQYEYAGRTFAGSAYKRGYSGVGRVLRGPGACAEISSRPGATSAT